MSLAHNMSEQHEACRSREQFLMRENSELDTEIDRLRMELHIANAERRLAMRALRILEYAFSKGSETTCVNTQTDSTH